MPIEGGNDLNKREHDACVEIYERYQMDEYRYLRKHNPGVQEHDIYDIMQEVWLALGDYIGAVIDRDYISQKKWLITVCKSRTIDFYRKRMRSEAMLEVETERQCYEGKEASYEYSVHDIVESKMNAEAILEGLTPKEREVLVKYYFGENPGKENSFNCKVYRLQRKIAKQLGVVDRPAHRSRRKRE